MRTQIEDFVSEIILSQTFNPNTDGDVEAPSGYFGYMTFGDNEFTVDGLDTPTELLGCTVIALVDSYGNIEYTVLSKDYLAQAGMDPNDDWKAHGEALAENWYAAQVNDFAEWCM